MTWTFEISLLVFLFIIFTSQAIATKIKYYIPMPLIMGLMCIAGFATGILPLDFIKNSNMIAVGTIAFNVLVIHSGTMINVWLIKSNYKNALVCIATTCAVVLVTGFGLSPVIGRELALLAPGSILGGGASCAIVSRWVLDKSPAISVFPWLIFMFQGLFAVPIVTWALKKEAKLLLNDLHSGKIQPPNGPPPKPREFGLCSKIPEDYKTTAYYLGSIMLVAVINKYLHATILAPFNININATGLIFGFILGQIGLMDKAPLGKSDSYGLLLLGLMGLMANTLANNPLGNILRLFPPLFIAFIVSTVILIAGGIIGARVIGCSKYRGIALTMNCVMGFPVNSALIKYASAQAQTEQEKGFLQSQLGPLLGMGTMLISNAVSIFLVSVMVNMV